MRAVQDTHSHLQKLYTLHTLNAHVSSIKIAEAAPVAMMTQKKQCPHIT